MEEEYDELDELDDNFDLENNEDAYLEDDEIIIPDDEDEEMIDDDYIYTKLAKRNNGRSSYLTSSLANDIVANESGGNYQAFNPHGGGEGAVGKYQFRWTAHKDKIRRFAGNPSLSKEEFMRNPELQDNFYEQYWTPHELMPAVDRIKRKGVSMSPTQLAKLVHFRGEKGALDYLSGKVGDKPESYNMSISKYIGKGQTGWQSSYETEQYVGNKKMLPKQFNLNNEIDLPEIKPIATNFNKQPSDYSGLGNTFNDVVNIGKDIYETGKKAVSGLVKSIDEGSDLVESYTSANEKNKAYRQMLQQMYQDNPSNYSPVTQRINNNPILV